MKKGYVQTSVILGVAGLMGSALVWTYSQLSTITAHAYETDAKVAALNEAVGTIKVDVGDIKQLQLQTIQAINKR